jgi:hypothetical protein
MKSLRFALEAAVMGARGSRVQLTPVSWHQADPTSPDAVPIFIHHARPDRAMKNSLTACLGACGGLPTRWPAPIVTVS